MGKLITLKDRITQESIYPATSSTSVLDSHGGNIMGIFDVKTDKILEKTKQSLGNIKQASTSISKLDGLSNATEKEKSAAKTVVQIQNNQYDTDILIGDSETIQEKFNNAIDKEYDIYDNMGIIDLIDNVIFKNCQISNEIPTFAPVENEVRMADGKLYIGLGKIWYVIDSVGSITIDTPNATISDTTMTLRNGSVDKNGTLILGEEADIIGKAIIL